MGYRSEWVLAAKATSEEQQANLESLKAWLDRQTKNQTLGEDKRACIKTVISCLQEDEKGLCIWSDDSTKCYDPWDSAIDLILEHGREELGLYMSYARLGEDMDDYYFDNDGSGEAYIMYERRINTDLLRD